MSAAFTNPNAIPWGNTWNDLLYEIILAYEERKMTVDPYSYWWRREVLEWNAATTYYTYGSYGGGQEAGLTCKYNGKLWVSLAEGNINHLPDEVSSEWWEEFTPIDAPMWKNDKTYFLNYKVRYAQKYWHSLQDSNTEHIPDENESLWWGADNLTINAQSTSVISKLQSWPETVVEPWTRPGIACSYFIDYLLGPLQGNPNSISNFNSAVRFYTLERWREVAGLNASGYRRATVWDGINEPTYEYGTMQRGDVIGPWIFEDLQKAYSALRWSSTPSTTSSPVYTRTYSRGFVPRYGATILAAQANSWACDWTDSQHYSGNIIAGEVFGTYQHGSSYRAYYSYARSSLTKKFISFYDFGVIDDSFYFYPTINGIYYNPINVFKDYGNGYAASQWNIFSSPDIMPTVDLAESWESGILGAYSFGISSSSAGWIIKWNFTNA